MSINLRYLEILYGVVGAREKFEDMTVQLIRTEHPSADRVRIFRGDGGIDAHNGGLTDPSGVDVFQVKYFPERIDDSQKDQIRKSFKRVRDNSAFRTRSWTLCIPIDMSVDEKIWFEEWKLKQTDSGILIRPVWGATKIQGLLMLDENRAIRESYFQQEHIQHMREMSGNLQQILEEFVGRVPKPERITLEACFEKVDFKTAELDSNWPLYGQKVGFMRFPLPLIYRALLQSIIEFHTVSEDLIGEKSKRTLVEVVEQEELYYNIQAALINLWNQR